MGFKLLIFHIINYITTQLWIKTYLFSILSLHGRFHLFAFPVQRRTHTNVNKYSVHTDINAWMTDVVRQVSSVSSQVLQLKSPQSSRVASIIGAHVLPAFRMFIFIIICVCPLTNTHGPKLRSFLTRFFNNTCFTYRFCSFFIAQKKNVDGICSSPLCSSDLSN